jgi:hypothetical protein
MLGRLYSDRFYYTKRLAIAGIGMTAVLHSWGQNLSHHSLVHCIMPGGGLSPEGRWVPAGPTSFGLSRFYRRRFLVWVLAAFNAEAGSSEN